MGEKDGAPDGKKKAPIMKKAQLTKKRQGLLTGSAKKSAKGRGKTIKRRSMWTMRHQEETSKQVAKSPAHQERTGKKGEPQPATLEKGGEQEEKSREVSPSMDGLAIHSQPTTDQKSNEGRQQQTEWIEQSKRWKNEKIMQGKDLREVERIERETASAGMQDQGQGGDAPKKRQRTILEYLGQTQEEGGGPTVSVSNKQKEQEQLSQLPMITNGECSQQEKMHSAEWLMENQDDQKGMQPAGEQQQRPNRQ